MDPQIAEILDLIKAIGAPAVGVLLTFKFMLNGLVKDVAEIKTDVRDIKDKQAAQSERVVALETWREAAVDS